MKQMSWIEHANPAFADDVAESFKIFDKDGNGTINKIELHHILTSLGDKMTTEEADEFCREASCDKVRMAQLWSLSAHSVLFAFS